MGMIQGAVNQLLTMGAAAKKATEITASKAEAAARAQRSEQRSVERHEAYMRNAAESAARAQRSEQRSVERHELYMKKAMDRAKQAISAKYNQNKRYQEFLESLTPSEQKNVPEDIKRIAFEAQKKQPEVRIGGSKADLSKFGPEAQEIIRRGMK